MKYLISSAFVLCLFLTACDDDSNDAKTKTVDKAGSVEVSLSTKHLAQEKDLLTTHYTIWKSGSKIREFDVKDTIPSLGVTKTDAENDKGETTTATIPKDYDFFVTVK